MLQLVLASCLAFAPASGPAPTSAPSEAADLSLAKQLFDEGTARYDAADYEGAIEKFTLALGELKGQGVDDFGIRGLLLFNIGRTHMRAFEIDDQVEHLKQAKSIFNRFIEEAALYPDQVDPADVDEAKGRLAEIDRLLAGTESAPEPDAGPSTPDDRPPPEPRDPAKLRAGGIGLSVAGVALLGGGIGMLAWGAGYGSAAEREVAGLDDAGLPAQSPAFADADAFVAAERRKGAAWMASGGVAAAIGVVGLALGVRSLVRAKQASRVTASAAFGREGVWVGVRGAF